MELVIGFIVSAMRILIAFMWTRSEEVRRWSAWGCFLDLMGNWSMIIGNLTVTGQPLAEAS